MHPFKRSKGNGVAQSGLEQADEFNGHFTDVPLNKTDKGQIQLPNWSAYFMGDIVASTEGVTRLLKGLNPSKALGPDELQPRVLKELATELASVYVHIFQQSICTDEIPKECTGKCMSPH